MLLGAACEFSSNGSGGGGQLGGGTAAETTAVGGSDSTGFDPTADSDSDGMGSTSVGQDEACVDVCMPGAPEGLSLIHI